MRGDFTPFDQRGALEIHRRRLPHWEQSQATYFVTFRLADALPASVVQMLDERRRLGALSEIEDWEWLDSYLDAGSGTGLLARPSCAQIVEGTLRHFDGVRHHLSDFVVMPNHVHSLVQPIGPYDLGSIVHSWKSFSAHRMQRDGHATGTLWQSESFDRLVRGTTELRRFQQYIHDNPSKAGLQEGRYLLGKGKTEWTTDE